MLRKKLSAPRIWIWIAGITLIIASGLGLAVWYFSRQWKPILDTQLRQLVLEASDSLYRIEYSKLNLNALTGNASVKDFKLIPDERVYQKLVLKKQAPDNLYKLEVGEVAIRNFHPKKLYSEKKLTIRDIRIDKPVLLIINRRQPYNDTVSTTKTKSLYQIVSKVFKEVRVDNIRLNDVDFTFDNRSNQPRKKTSIKNLNIDASDLLIDSLSENDRNRFYHTRKVDVFLHDYRIATPDSLYFLSFKDLKFSTIDKKLVIEQVSLDPRYSKVDFYKKVGYAKDRYNLDFDRIAINRIDLQRFLHSQKLYAGSLDLDNASIDVYNNGAYPRKRTDKTGKFPHQQLKKLALDLKIDTVNIRKASIGYSEYNPNSKQTGKIYFNQTSGRLFNLTNDAQALAKNQLMKAHFRSRFMNAGLLDIHFTFNLTSPKGAFDYSGSLKNMDGRALNQITKPLGLIEVKSAAIKDLSFRVKADQHVARGTMEFYYDKLSFNLLKKDEETDKLKKQGLVSGVANILVIHESNPGLNGKFTPGVIYYERIYWQSFFSFVWKSLFTGVKASVGVTAEKESRIRNTVEKVSGFFEKLKEKREEGKQRRQEKREKRREEKKLKKAEKATQSEPDSL